MLIDGAPAALVYASVRRADAEGEPVETFTNRVGVFALSNLAPGEYILNVAGRNLEFRFAVTEDAPAFIQIGDVSMTR